MIMWNLSTECNRACWKQADQQDMNDKEIVLELIEVQENSYFSAEEMSEDDVENIGETKIKEDHTDTISMTI